MAKKKADKEKKEDAKEDELQDEIQDSQSEEEKTEAQKSKDWRQDIKKDAPLIISLIIVVALFGVIIWGMQAKQPTQSEKETIVYNGYVFTKEEGVWKTNMYIEDKFEGWRRQYTFLFHYTPGEVENITTLRNARNETISPNLFLNTKNVYITTDPEYPSQVVLGAVEIAKIIGQIYDKDVQAAITRSYADDQYPVVTCDNISQNVRVISLRIGDRNGIFSEKGCVIIEGRNAEEVLKASERLSFEMLKIL